MTTYCTMTLERVKGSPYSFSFMADRIGLNGTTVQSDSNLTSQLPFGFHQNYERCRSDC